MSSSLTVLPEVTLGNYLDRLSCEILGSYGNRTRDPNYLEVRLVVETLTELDTTIQNVRNHFHGSLNNTFASFNEKSKAFFSSLESLFKQLSERHNLAHIHELLETTRKINDQLPQFFPEANPLESRFIRLAKQYVAIGPETTSIKVKMLGVFFFPTFASLKVGDHEIKPSQAEPQTNMLQSMQLISPPKCREVEFEIPVSHLGVEVAKDCFTYIRAQFKTPWWESGKVIWGNQHEDSYPIRLGLLPSTVGKILVDFVALRQGQVNRTRKSKGFCFEFKNGIKEQTETFRAPNDWKFRDVTIVCESHSTSVKPKSVILDNHRSCQVTIKLEGNVELLNGLLFHLVISEYLEVEKNQIRKGIVNDLLWGTSKKIVTDPIEKILSIDFVAFNGQHFTLPPATDASNPYIKLYADQGSLLIEARDPNDSEMDFPAFITDSDPTMNLVATTLAHVSAPFLHQVHDLNERITELEKRRMDGFEGDNRSKLEQSIKEIRDRQRAVNENHSKKLMEFKEKISLKIDDKMTKMKEKEEEKSL